MRKQDTLLMGFDAREMWLGEKDGWDQQRKMGFLFRLEVDKPLSIDQTVWASVFDIFPELELPYTGIYTGLWENLEHLEACLQNARNTLKFKKFYIVAFAVMTAAWTADERSVWGTFLRGMPPEGKSIDESSQTPLIHPTMVEESWPFLGHDVADFAGGTSALANMGFLPGVDDVEGLRARWGPHLNRAHLFEAFFQANAFKEFSNRRISEHAPFFVYGLWLVRCATYM